MRLGAGSRSRYAHKMRSTRLFDSPILRQISGHVTRLMQSSGLLFNLALVTSTLGESCANGGSPITSALETWGSVSAKSELQTQRVDCATTHARVATSG